MRHFRMSWQDTAGLSLGETQYLLDMLEDERKQAERKDRLAERSSKAGRGVKLTPVIT